MRAPKDRTDINLWPLVATRSTDKGQAGAFHTIRKRPRARVQVAPIPTQISGGRRLSAVARLGEPMALRQTGYPDALTQAKCAHCAIYDRDVNY